MKRFLVVAMAVGLLSGFGGPFLAEVGGQDSGAIAKIQQVNRLMGRAIGMVTEGANLVLVANMKLAPPIDSNTAEQGMKLIDSGRDLVRMALAGEGMTAMDRKAMDGEPMMKVAQGLGDSILQYIELVQGMEMSGTIEGKIQLHQLHLRINNALDMAAEGANLVMLGNLKLAEVLDKYSVERGSMLLKDARAILAGVPDSQAMKEARKGSGDDATMKRTGELIQTALKIVDALEKMSM